MPQLPPLEKKRAHREGSVHKKFRLGNDERENLREGGCGYAGHKRRTDERWSGANFEWPDWSVLGLAS